MDKIQALLADLGIAPATVTLPQITCFVRGCHQPTFVGRNHKHNGFVVACQGHDPERVGYALPFYPEPLEVPEKEAPEAEAPVQSPEEMIGEMFRNLVLAATKKQRDQKGPDDGRLTKLIKPKKPQPPAGPGLTVPVNPFRGLAIDLPAEAEVLGIEARQQ